MSRSLSGLSNNNVYVNSMFSSGTAINIQQTSNNTQAKVNLDISAIADTQTVSAENDIYVLETNSGSIKKITKLNLFHTPSLTTPKIKDSGGDHTYNITVNELSANRNCNLPLLGADDVFVFADFAQVLTNKTLTLPKISESSGSEKYTIAGGSISADRTITLPDLGGNDIFVTEAMTQTLTNKSLTSPALTTPTIAESSGSEKYTIAGGSISSDRTVTLPNLGGNDIFVTEAMSQTLSNKTIDSSNSIGAVTLTGVTLDNPLLKASGAGGSAGYKYSLAGANLGATQQLNFPLITATDTLVSENVSQTLTQKTLTSPTVNEIIMNDASGGSVTTITLNAEESANNQTVSVPPIESNVRFVVTEASVKQTITNTTLNSATINNPIMTLPEIFDSNSSHKYRIMGEDLGADRDVTIPAVGSGGDTFVMEAYDQTLTNKTIVSPFLTTPKINDKDATHEYRITAPFNLADHRIINLPQLLLDQDFVFDKHSQTLTNKTLTDPTIGTIFSDTTTFKKADGTVKFKMDSTNIGIATNFATTKTPPTSQSNTALAGVQIGGGNGSTIVSRWAGASGDDGSRYYMLNFIPPYHLGGPWSFWTEDTTASYFGLSYGSSFLWYADSSLNLVGNQAWSPSDERIKEDIVDADTTECINIIKRLPLKKYKYKQVLRDKCAGFTQSEIFGFIAQDIKADPVMNYACTTSDTAKYYDKETNSQLEYEVENLEVINKPRMNAVTWGAVGGLIELVEAQQVIIDKLTSSTTFKSFRESL